MALASPGAENPSAAFLAGQQHGQALATQHHAAATAAPVKSKAAAPTKPAPKQVASTSTPSSGSFDLAGLLKQAQALAEAQTQAQIRAIRGQQGVYTQQGTDRAAQINQAAQAAAQFLSGLGDQTSSSYTDAAKALGGLAAGFSGQVGQDATSAADSVQANLANLGAPSGSARTATGQTSSPGGLQNVLYGLGGFIPGNLLLTSGEAAAAAARGLPASVLGHGQLEASGTLAAGQKQADTLTPQILEAQGKTPELARSIYNSALNGVYKQAQLGLSAQKLADAEKNTVFDQNYKIATYNLNVTKTKLEATRVANAQFNADRSYQVSLAHLGIDQAKLQQTIVQNAFKAAHGGYTAKDLTKLLTQANGLANGYFHGTTSTRTVNGTAKTTSTSGLPYNAALAQLMRKGIPVQVALKALDRVYPENLRPTAEALAQTLGPLTPEAVMNTISQHVSAETGASNAVTGNSLSSLTHAGGFLPTNVQFVSGRADQGRDIQTFPGAAIIAPGAGVVVAVKSDPGGGGAHFGPSYPVVHFTSGPYAGKTVYIGHTVAALKPGQSFTAGSVLSHTQASGPMNGGAPSGWAEIGFAPGGSPGSFGQQPPF